MNYLTLVGFIIKIFSLIKTKNAIYIVCASLCFIPVGTKLINIVFKKINWHDEYNICIIAKDNKQKEFESLLKEYNKLHVIAKKQSENNRYFNIRNN